MKKLILGGGILGSLTVVVLFVWMLIAGAKSLWENTPLLFDRGKGIVTEAVRKADGILPGVAGGIEQVAPGVIDKVKNLVPVADIPAKDVGGEDIVRSLGTPA